MENHSNSYSSMEMDEEHRGSPKASVCSKRSVILLVSGALVIFVLFVMIFVIFGYQERRFAELERSMTTHHSSVNSMNSDLKGKLTDTGAELETMILQLKTSVSGLSSYVDLYTSRIQDQLKTGPQVKKLSEIQILIIKLNSSLASLSSKMETKLQDAGTQQDGQSSELKRFLDRLNSSISELTAKLQDTDQKVMAGLSEMKDKLKISSKTAVFAQESQNRTLAEVVKLSSSVESLSSKLQSTDQKVMATLSNMKTKLESSGKIAVFAQESQNRTLAEVVKLSSSVESLSSKLQSTDQKVMAALSEMKAKLESCSKTAEGGSTCKPGWTPQGCKCYFFSTDKLNWHQARDYCRSQSASLLKLETKDEWVFVTARTTLQHYWVGLTDEDTGQWRWTDGTPYVMNKDDWEVGQPDDWKNHGLGEEGEDCGHLKAAGKFNDAHCSNSMKYICKA
uniref:C-type lectin domain-containing protein n=1 Tax=Pygocentrus nattereri TaxID=42514 RepID=A0AAR2J7N0_PYGNA